MGKLDRKRARAAKRSSNGKASLAWRGLERLVAQHHGDVEKDNVTELQPCGHCGQHQNGLTHGAGLKAKVGEYGVCWACAGVSRFGENFERIMLSEAEVEALDPEEVDVVTLREMRALIVQSKFVSIKRTTGEA